ncbi:MAG: DsbA family protein [Gammaproteobacteria bacterium]|jgi:protein-disulfide isomerase|nr:DsbA family protein [Gammaproteobacteria bacterium]MDH3847223.1 DsbA family protein [Gammaproteobacteria bacterium]MDH3864386.1 DsbA family protein [Gammaproteobacteria bacterium]MDH3907602.1 DsbA family protein [Gammaproteobacteria bacterium]NCF58613.1 thioredoxin domain-containing protein [Gammaproteobacteria bacterium]
MNNDNIRTGLLAAALGGLLLATLLYGCGDSQPSQAEDDVRQAALASEHSPTLGPPDAKVHIVEFLDPACGTCALFYPMVKGWMADIPDEIRLSVRHVAFHDGVDYAVRVLEASRNQGKYWETLETLLASQRQWVNNHIVQPDSVLPALAGVGLDMDQLQADMSSAEVLERIEKDMQDSKVLKVVATPEYFVNGRQLPSFGQEQLANLVREELQK